MSRPEDTQETGGSGQYSKWWVNFLFHKQNLIAEQCFLSGGNMPSAKFPHIGNQVKWNLVHFNEEYQIYSRLLVVGYNFIPVHFVLRINVLEKQDDT